MQQQHQQEQNTPQHSDGWLREQYHRFFGRRDPVEVQLRDIARQGTLGAAISHFFAGFLIVLFSAASLIALGADSFRAMVRSIQLGVIDIPNTVASGVTGFLVPCMDVAILRAASKIRLLATRRATKKEMALHIGVVVVVSVIEAATYCYMALLYQHPSGWADWALIAARAFAAPLIGVYLAMDRPHPVTSRDILAQVELGAGAGVIRDVTEIANDTSAPLDRKMELFGASAVMREHERERLERLIEVARKREHGAQAALPAPAMLDVFSRNGHKTAVGAPVTLPLVPAPQEHSSDPTYSPYKAMHDWDEYDDAILDEVSPEDAAEALFGTQKLDEDELDGCTHSDAATTTPKQRVPRKANSRPTPRNHSPSKAVREYHRQVKVEAKQQRRSAVRDAVYAILDEWHADGEIEHISDRELARRVATRVDFAVNPSGNTVARWRGPWRASRTHKAEIERESSESVPMVADDIVEMLETDQEEALV